MFVSKVFSAVQKRWATCEQEMFGVYFCVKKLHYLIGGRKFTVRSDHRNLQYWSHVSASAKVERWKLALTEYDFDLEYIKGEENLVADAMSRVDTEDTVTSNDTVFTIIVPDNFEDISRAKDIDNKTLLPNPIIVEQVDKVLVLSSRKPTDFDEEIRSVHGGIEGHWGVRATIKRLQEKGIEWKNMSRDVKSFVQSCPICQKLTDKSSHSHGSSFTVSVEEPNQRVAIDTIGPLHEDDRGYK
jgi:hypothetical protein